MNVNKHFWVVAIGVAVHPVDAGASSRKDVGKRAYRRASRIKTVVRCERQIMTTSDLEANHLVAVEGREKEGVIEVTKITIHRDWLMCREIKGAEDCHCKC